MNILFSVNQLLMCGMETVSFNDLKIHTVVSGSSAGFKEVVEWFWNIASGFTQEEMAKLIQFVTGELVFNFKSKKN